MINLAFPSNWPGRDVTVCMYGTLIDVWAVILPDTGVGNAGNSLWYCSARSHTRVEYSTVNCNLGQHISEHSDLTGLRVSLEIHCLKWWLFNTLWRRFRLCLFLRSLYSFYSNLEGKEINTQVRKLTLI